MEGSEANGGEAIGRDPDQETHEDWGWEGMYLQLLLPLSLVKTIVQLWKGFEDNPVGLLLWHGEWENPR